MLSLNERLCSKHVTLLIFETGFLWIFLKRKIFLIKNIRDGTQKEETRTKYKQEWIKRHQKKAQRTLSMWQGNMCEYVTGDTFYSPQYHWGTSGPTLYPFSVHLKMSTCSLECCRDCHFLTGHPRLLQKQSKSLHRSVPQREGNYWWTLSSLCSPRSPNKRERA